MTMTDMPAAPSSASPELVQQLSQITQQLRDALSHLGIAPTLRSSAEGLSDARSRLGYIARKTGDAAERVLTAVESAKQERARIVDAARQIHGLAAAGAAGGAAAGELAGWAGELDAAASQMDEHLTEIMLAQDFHDLTGQVVAKVIALAVDLEEGLLKLLLELAPADGAAALQGAARPGNGELDGPVIDAAGRVEVVTNQSEVDDLLAEFGF